MRKTKYNSPELIRKSSNENIVWSQCECAGFHPRGFFVADFSAVSFIDARVKKKKKSFLIDLPLLLNLKPFPPQYNPHIEKALVEASTIGKTEQIHYLKIHPAENFQFFVSSTTYLSLFDKRYVKMPLIRWSHHQATPIKHIQIVSVSMNGFSHNIFCSDFKGGKVNMFRYDDDTIPEVMLQPKNVETKESGKKTSGGN